MAPPANRADLFPSVREAPQPSAAQEVTRPETQNGRAELNIVPELQCSPNSVMDERHIG
jgi:hypothetical protein